MFLLRMTRFCWGWDEDDEDLKYGELPSPKYWTGQMLETWPAYLRDIKRAKLLKTRKEAEQILFSFKGSFDSESPSKPHFCWEIVPA